MARSKREAPEGPPPVDAATEAADDLPVEGEVLGPDEYILIAPLKVGQTEYKPGDKVTLTPRQADFARGQKCID